MSDKKEFKNIIKDSFDDDKTADDYKEVQKKQLNQAKHKISMNVYTFLSFCTNPIFLMIAVVGHIYILYPLSSGEFFISKYLKLSASVLHQFFLFLMGAIVCDWAQHRYTK